MRKIVAHIIVTILGCLTVAVPFGVTGWTFAQFLELKPDFVNMFGPFVGLVTGLLSLNSIVDIIGDMP